MSDTKVDLCKDCGHDFDNHRVWRLGDAQSGFITCPVNECPCHMTWEIRGPDDDAPPHRAILN